MTALDLSREHLRHTSQHLAAEGLATTAVYGDAEAMPFPGDSFDLVYAFGVLHHTPNTAAAITEIHRVLRSGGTAIVGLYHRNSLFFWTKILYRGIYKGGLLNGWRRFLSTIEYRSDPCAATPLVKVYGRHQVRRLFRMFPRVLIETRHVSSGLAGLFQKLMCWPAEEAERRLGKWGWYIIVHATKA